MKRILITFILLTGFILSGRSQKTMNDLEPLPPGYEYTYDYIVEPIKSDKDGYYYPFYWVGFVLDTPMFIDIDTSGSEYLSHVFLTLMDPKYNIIETLPIHNLGPDYKRYSRWLLPGTYIVKCEIMKRYNTIQGCLRFRMTTGFLDPSLEPEPLPELMPDRQLNEPIFTDRDTMMHHTYTDVQTMLSAYKDTSSTVRSRYDGLGREITTVYQGITPDGGDLHISKEYDATGRVYKTWLPQTPGWTYTDHRPSEITGYEPVPFENPSAHFAAGEGWNTAPVNSDALINNTSERLSCAYYLVWKDTLQYGGMYATGDLNVVRTVDEDSLVRYDFTDKAGQLVLSRQMDGDSMYDTHYVYDIKQNLRFVLPPALLTGDVDCESLNRYAYQYKYNNWGKCTWQKNPGCDSITYLYDGADKLIYSQDGNQRKCEEYTFRLYDSLGREVVKGICTSPDLRFLTSEKCNSNRVQDDSVLDSGYSLGGMRMTPAKLLSVNYYDNYDFLDLPVFSAEKPELTYCETAGYDEKYINKDHPEISERGLITGTCIYTLEEESNILTAMYYDAKGRIAQSRTVDHRKGIDTDYFHYTFTGKVLQQLHTREEKGSQLLKETSVYTYDAAERLLQVEHQLNDGKATILSANEYDELCRLKRRTLNNGKQSLEYTYNIRNWVTDINNPLFSQSLHYNDGIGVPCYGGNISSMTWKTGDSSERKGYQFTYDELSRLKDAVYAEGDAQSTNLFRYDEQVTGYDKMGNILGLKRNGRTSNNDYGVIDDLKLTYDGNHLKSVGDNAPHSAYAHGFDFKDGAEIIDEYLYDVNGNLIQDLNKKITGIRYNCLNLPRRIEFENGDSISYLYDANGTKLRSTHVMNGSTLITDYCGNVIYENGIAHTLLTEVGYVSLGDGKYHYYLKDHQGNNRVVVDENGVVEELNDYYPFGGLMGSSTASVQDYKYNGKELDRKGGLDWYDYGARHYDAALGRWHVVDPMAEKYYGISPYGYCFNNPLNRIDPDGREVIALDKVSKRNIINTLTKEEAKYVSFNKKGVLNTEKLQKSKSKSENMTALKTLASSKTKYNFQVVDKDIDGEAFSLTYKGLTAIPGEENKPSPNDDVFIQTSSFLNEKEQTMNVAHEAYGHAYFYELGKTDKSYDYQHRYKSVVGNPEWDNEFKMYIYPSIRTETNLRLKKQIEITTEQAAVNYDSRKKK